MAGNPFEVDVPNLSSAFSQLMTGYDESRKRTTENETKSQLARLMGVGGVGADGAAGGADWQTAARTMAASGNLDGAVKLATMAKTFTPETSSDIQNYNYGLKNPGFVQQQKELNASKATRVSQNVQSGEKSYDQAMGKELADLNVGIIKGAGTARGNIASLDRLEQALQDPAVYQGTGGEKVLALKRLAKSAGMDVEGVADAELAQSITNQLALNARNPAGGAGMPGAMSDTDREYLKAMQPGIDKTPGGNRQMIDANRKINQRALEVEKFRQDYIRKNGRLNEGFYSALSDWANANPLFPAGPKQPRAGAAPGQQTQPRQAADGKFYVPDPNRPGKYLEVRP